MVKSVDKLRELDKFCNSDPEHRKSFDAACSVMVKRMAKDVDKMVISAMKKAKKFYDKGDVVVIKSTGEIGVICAIICLSEIEYDIDLSPIFSMHFKEGEFEKIGVL